MNYFVGNKGCHFEMLFWGKTNPTPTCNCKYLSDVEYCLMFRETGTVIGGTYETKSKFYISQTNKEDKEKFEHDTIKPLKLVKNHIINSSNEGDVILDTFIGSGTTAVACKELGRQYIGFEINEKYFNIAKDRLNGISKNGQMDLFATDFEQLDLFNNEGEK